MDDEVSSVCLVVPLFDKAFIVPFNNIRNILFNISKSNFAIVAWNPDIYQFQPSENTIIISHRSSGNLSQRLFKYSILNFKIAVEMVRKRKDVRMFFFFSETAFHLPMLIAYILGKNIVWMLPSSLEKMTLHRRYTLSKIILRLQPFYFRLTDGIILYSADLVDDWGLRAYEEKIRIARHHNIDINQFNIDIPYNRRKALVGFVGRFSEEKGILLLIQAIASISHHRNDIQFLCIGDGPCMDKVQQYISDNKLGSRVTLLGWIESSALSTYLNQMTLLILPSATEGLPNVILQSMACGTPVLASRIGAIPSVITNGHNGYLLDNNSATGIAESLLKVINDPLGSEVSVAARKTIENYFTFTETAAEMERVLSLISNS